ncbi:unnamed protein product, partial [Prorocentrum cordatum]
EKELPSGPSPPKSRTTPAGPRKRADQEEALEMASRLLKTENQLSEQKEMMLNIMRVVEDQNVTLRRVEAATSSGSSAPPTPQTPAAASSAREKGFQKIPEEDEGKF